MDKIIIELQNGANFEEALKVLGQLSFVSEIKYIQTNDQQLYQNTYSINSPATEKSMKEWDNAVESEDFWKNG